jgi:hypothetical protein
MGFQPGNKGGGKRKEKLFYDALMLAVKDTDNPRDLRKIAEKLLDMAIGGDIQAIKEVANRLDGMPVQAIDATIETTHFVARVPEVAQTSDEWLKQNAPAQTIQ